jgi:hypothetical protein
MKKPIQNFFNIHYEAMVLSIEFMVRFIQSAKNFNIQKCMKNMF